MREKDITFVGIENRGGHAVAKFHRRHALMMNPPREDPHHFVLNKHNVEIRKANLEKDERDTFEERLALKALAEVKS